MERFANYLRVLTWAAAGLVLAVPLLAWNGTALPLAAVAAMPPFVTVAWGLLQLSGFYRRVADGLQFTSPAAAALRRFGWSLVAASLLLLPCRVVSLALSQQLSAVGIVKPAAALAATLGTIIGFITILFARILDHATELAEENASFL